MKLREKMMNLPKGVVVVIGVIIAALFLFVLRLAGTALSFMAELPGYGSSMLGELIAGIAALGVLALFGYTKVLKEKGVGFAKGFYIGGFFVGYCGLEIFAMIYLQAMEGITHVEPVLNILIFIVTMILIGWTEEIFFRGVILNLFLDSFSKTKGGILAAIILSSVIFGGMHIANIFSGVEVVSALVQAIQASLLGIIFAAVYVRTKNIWIGIIMHACIDFVGLMPSGIFGVGTEIDGLNNISLVNLISVPIFLIPCIVLLRKAKLEEIVRRENGEVIFDTYEEAESMAITSLVVGIIGLLLGCTGYGLGLGIVGILGSVLSKKFKRENNGIATAGMVLSILAIVISCFGGVIMTVTYSMADEVLKNYTMF